MASKDFQLIVIGSGPGGYVAAVRAAQLGLKVACVEKSSSLGGTCLNIGCIPSKALLQTSFSYHWMRTASNEQGIKVGDVEYDFDAMMKRKESIVKGLVDGVAWQFKTFGVTRLEGEASFISPYEIAVGGKTYTADTIIIATGSEPSALPFLPFDEKTVVSSTGALSLTTVPKRLVVIGGGVIGVELASVYRRLGSEVTVVEMMETLLPGMESALSKQLLASLKKQGMTFYLGAKVTGAEVRPDGATVSFVHEGQERTLDADVVLVAVGRKPYTKGLALEKAGVQLSPKGMITVDGAFRTSQPHIYAIGDVIEGPMLAHKASHEGTAVAENLGGKSSHVDYITVPNVVYTHPEVASVGFSESEAKAAGIDAAVGTSFFKANGRARCAGDTEGFVKIVGDKKSGKLLGVHIIGAAASELIAEGVVALGKRMTVDELAHACHAHPTLSEVIMEACQAL